MAWGLTRFYSMKQNQRPMEKGQISVQSKNIFPIIKKFLYSDHEIFLRELVSNAIDATQKLKTLVNKGVVKSELGDLTIEVTLDENARTITVTDRGIGMSDEEVKSYLNEVAFSSAQDFLEKYKTEDAIIGHFGLGFYSAFMVADKVEVNSKSYRRNEKPIKWICEGEPEYSIEYISARDRGTEVVLYLNDENNEFLKRDRIESLLKKYCSFLPVPIKFGTKTVTEYEGEGEDQKEIKREEDNIINNPDPAWKKNPTALREEDYKSFYNELYPFSNPPLFWIHLNIDYPFHLTGILYFPKISNTFEVQKNKIQLYSNQVFVTDEVKEIVPEFLTLLHGVIDSPDIPLNVSRSYLQSDPNVKKITSYITRKVAEKLNNLYKKKPEEYKEKWPEIGLITKYGMITEEKFYEKALNFALFKNIEGSYFTIEEYKDKIKPAQSDKYKKIIALYTNNPKDHHSYIESAKSKGYDILEFDQIIDNHFIQHLEYKLGDMTFVRVDSDTIDNIIQKDEQQESVLSDSEQEKVKSIFESALKESGFHVSLKPLSPEDHPVVITRPEFIRRMSEMQAFQGMKNDGFPESMNVIVNTNNELIAQKLVKMRGEEKRENFVKYLFDLARLNQKMLQGEELASFIQRSLQMAKE